MIRTPWTSAALIAALLAPLPAVASDKIVGSQTTFTSPNGVTELCVRIAPMPGAIYSKHDRAQEEAFCSIDFYASTVALCPKTWSTSPGMMIYDVSSGPYAGDRTSFERLACAEGKSAGDQAQDELGKFKPTMNAKGTSGTFSASPLLYYHFSRYFRADIGVPVAVWRSMDRQMHLTEVARPGLALSGSSHSSAMNAAGWHTLVAADEDPDSYKPTDDLFTADQDALYGALTHSPGSRYNSAVNGTRKSGWGKGQNRDFQNTAPFLALRTDKPLPEAIAAGIAAATKDPQLRRDMGNDTSAQQVAYWMTDLANIVLLDFIFSQQDRVGNIDYIPYAQWIEDGAIKRERLQTHGKSGKAGHPDALTIRRTHLNDNDAGGRVEYANFAKSTGMLDNLHHFPATTYRQLMALSADFAAEGPLLIYLRDSFGLNDPQVAQVVSNTAIAAGLLSAQCQAGTIRFDLDPDAFFLTGKAKEEPVDCGGG